MEFRSPFLKHTVKKIGDNLIIKIDVSNIITRVPLRGDYLASLNLTEDINLGISDFTTSFQDGKPYLKRYFLFGLIPVGFERLPYSILNSKEEIRDFINDVATEEPFGLVQIENEERLKYIVQKLNKLESKERQKVLHDYLNHFWEDYVILELDNSRSLVIYCRNSQQELNYLCKVKSANFVYSPPNL